MYQRILVPIDGSPTANRGLKEAIALAKLTGAQLRLIHVVDDLSSFIGADALVGGAVDMMSLLREQGIKILAVAKAQTEFAAIAVDTVLHDCFTGRISDLIVAEATAWSADLIVIGTHGRRGVERLFMGSDAEQILRVAPVPVLLVRVKTT